MQFFNFIGIWSVYLYLLTAQHLQRSPAAGTAGPDGIWGSASLQACQQKLRLQSLQLERERLKQRQQEIRLQVKHIHFFYLRINKSSNY